MMRTPAPRWIVLFSAQLLASSCSPSHIEAPAAPDAAGDISPTSDLAAPDALAPADAVDAMLPDATTLDATAPDAPADIVREDVVTPDAALPDGTAPDATPADVATTTAPAILFVTQVPWSGFTVVSSTFGNHVASIDRVPRGGALMLRQPDGTLRDLTREAGYGMDGMQLDRAIAVREPCVHWDGRRALFSMVVGAATARYQVRAYYWQVYEVTGLGAGERVVITRVPGQRADRNNVSPVYGSDDRVLFISDDAPSGEAHHYPQLDEYESAPTTAGIYAADAMSGRPTLLEAAPSGVFSMSVDSAGRLVFTKWDHLQRDQQGDAPSTAASYGAFTWADESATAARTTELRGAEVFPEARAMGDPAYDATLSQHTFNQFFPWQLRQDGTGEETLNHIGRHEWGGTYSDGSFRADTSLTYNTPESYHRNRFRIRGDGGLLHVRESPTTPGTFFATWAPEFGSDGAGAILRFNGAVSDNPDDMVLTPVTHPDCYRAPDNPADAASSTGHYRNPLPLSDGTLVASYTRAVTPDRNRGTSAAPDFVYDFRLVRLAPDGMYARNGATLTTGLRATVQWWSPDTLVSWSGTLWELDPVELRPRPRPPLASPTLAAPEQSVFTETRVALDRFRAWLRARNLALVVGRNATQRERSDVQQPFNLAVPGGARSVVGTGHVYDVAYLQLFEGDALRGYGGTTSPRAGRRLLARPIHGASLPAQTPAGAPSGSVALGMDGSFAAYVPAGRPLTWQLTDRVGGGVVRERDWVSFAPGEVRSCPSCHGINRLSQTGAPEPSNPPAALRALLTAWAAANP